MKHLSKFAALALSAALVLGFASCKANVETEYVTVEKKVPTDMTGHDAVAVYHWKQNTSGVGYEKVTYEENEDGTVKEDDSGNYVAIETAQTVAAGTKLANLAKTFYGFKAKGLGESLQADGTYAVNVYYDRNIVKVTVTGGVSAELTGLYGSGIDMSSVNAKIAQGSFISSTDIPATYPAEDKSYTVTLGTTTVDGSDGFVKIAKGSFKRASSASATAYNITLSKDFYVCDHQVTQGEWEKYMTYYGEVISSDSDRPVESYGKGENSPVYRVCWYEAVIYANLLSKANNLTPAYYITVDGEKKTDPADWVNSESLTTNIKKTDDGKYYYDSTSSNSLLDYNGDSDTDGGIQLESSANGYRLPTEAEWEYAALGSFKDNSNWNGYGDSSAPSAYVFAGYDGTNADDIGKYAWYSGDANSTIHEVKGKLANSYGLYDMSGNVWELCHDWYYFNYASNAASDPVGASSCIYRVLRGGSRVNDADNCTVSYRSSCYPYLRILGGGLRLVRSSSAE